MIDNLHIRINMRHDLLCVHGLLKITSNKRRFIQSAVPKKSKNEAFNKNGQPI